MRTSAKLSAGLVSSVLFVSILKAQTGLSTIRGAITDSTGPFPQFVSTMFYQRDGQFSYNGLSLEAHRTSGPFTFDLHWTWSKSLVNYLDLENPYDHYFWNRDGNIPNHRVVANVSWYLPVGRGEKFLANAPAVANGFLGGWQLNYVGIFATGLWFSPSYSGADPSGTNTFGGLPDRVRDGNLPAVERTVQRWFDTAAFVVPPAGRFGNSGVNILEGPGRNVHNLSLSKMFNITERIKFQLLAAATNLFNHPHFSFPATNVSVPTGGVISTSYDISGLDRASARAIDIRARIKW